MIDVQATQAGTVSFPHVTLVLEDNAEASVIVVYRSADGFDRGLSPGRSRRSAMGRASN